MSTPGVTTTEKTTTIKKEAPMPAKKTQTDEFQRFLDAREKTAIEKVENAREALATERETVGALKDAVEAAEAAVSDVEGKAKGGDPSVTGLTLLEVRGNHEVATLALTGNQTRIKRLTDALNKSHTRKDIASIVKDALVVHAFPGVDSYATFASGGGFVRDQTKPESVPALVVTQLEGSVGAGGAGEGKVRITYHRTPVLHAPMDAERLRAALEAAGFRIDRTASLNNGVVVHTRDNTDEADIYLGSVADRVPLVTSLLADVDGWDESLALLVTSSDVEAQGVGAQIVSTDEDDNGILTTTIRLSVAVKQIHHGDDLNLRQMVVDRAQTKAGKAVPGAGRCTDFKVEQIRRIEHDQPRGIRAALIGAGVVFAVELTYKAHKG